MKNHIHLKKPAPRRKPLRTTNKMAHGERKQRSFKTWRRFLAKRRFKRMREMMENRRFNFGRNS